MRCRSVQEIVEEATQAFASTSVFRGVAFAMALLAFAAVDASADTASANGYTWSYRVNNDGTAEIFQDGGNGFGTTAISPVPRASDMNPEVLVRVPETLDGYRVTRIGEGAFQDCSAIYAVELPSSITRIGEYAFYRCTAMEIVEISDGVLSIGEGAFSYCSSLQALTVPASVQEIGDYAFQYCTWLMWVKYLGDCPTATDTMYNDTPQNLMSIVPVDASGWDEALGAGVWRGREVYAFGTESANGYTWSYLLHGDVAEIWKGSDKYPGETDPAISPKPVGAVNVPSTLGGKPVKRIGDGAFRSCSDMTDVTMPASLTSIGQYAFYSCSGLASLNLPKGVTNVESHAFYFCGSLDSVTVPASVTHIGNSVFGACDALTHLYCHPDPDALTWDADGYAAIGYEIKMVSSAKIHVKPRHLEQYQTKFGQLVSATFVGDLSDTAEVDGYTWSYQIDDYGNAEIYKADDYNFGTTAISPMPDKYVTVPETLDGHQVTRIGEGAFMYCEDIAQVYLPSNVTSIGDFAFYHCKSLAYVSIPDGLVSIGESAFGYCSAMKSITVPASVQEIGHYAFQDCTSLMWVKYLGDCPTAKATMYNNTPLDAMSVVPVDASGWDEALAAGVWQGRPVCALGTDSANGYTWSYLLHVDTAEIWKDSDYWGGGVTDSAISPTPVGAVTIPSTLGGKPVTRIGNFAFWKLDEMTGVTMPATLTSIGDGAFLYCTSLKSATIPVGVTSIGDDAFSDVALENVTIPDGVTSIGAMAFFGNAYMKSITISATVTNIGYNAFASCPLLTDMHLYADPNALTWDVQGDAYTGYHLRTDGNPVIHVKPDQLRQYQALFNNKLADATLVGDLGVVYVTVTFDANGGKGGTKRPIVSGAALGTLPSATRNGYTLKGWYTAKSGGTKVSSSTKVTKNVTYYAQWTLNKYKITFDANGGKGGTSRTVANGASLGTLPNATRKGYTLKGWYTKKSGGSKMAASTKVTKAVTYYAQWTANKYKIKFHKNGGTGTMKALSATYDKNVSLRANAFKRTGYKFAGWAKTKTGKVAYKNKAKVKNLTTVNDRVVTLYAVWKKS